jgi:two-component system response regulator DevR
MSSTAQPSVIRVFLVDDHEVVRRGVADVLSGDAEITVVGEAKNAAEAMSRVPALRPDVAVLDVRLPDGDGVTLCRDLRAQLPDSAW